MTLRDRFKNARAAFRAGYSLSDLDALMDRAISGSPSNTGVDVSGDSALNFSAVFCATQLIAGSIASIPLQLYRRVGDNAKTPEHNHPLYDILHNQANPEMTSYVFRETLQAHLLLQGNAYAEIQRDRPGRVAALWPWNPEAVRVRRNPATKLIE